MAAETSHKLNECLHYGQSSVWALVLAGGKAMSVSCRQISTKSTIIFSWKKEKRCHFSQHLVFVKVHIFWENNTIQKISEKIGLIFKHSTDMAEKTTFKLVSSLAYWFKLSWISGLHISLFSLQINFKSLEYFSNMQNNLNKSKCNKW